MKTVSELMELGCLLLLIPITGAYFIGYINSVLPTLTKHGKPSLWPSQKGEHEQQVRQYGELCREHGYSMGWYRYLVAARWVMLGLVALAAAFMILNWWAGHGEPVSSGVRP